MTSAVGVGRRGRHIVPALGPYRIAARDEAVKRTDALLAEHGVKFGVPSPVGPGAQVSQHLGGAAASFRPLGER